MAYAFKHGDRPLDGFCIQRAVGRGGFGEVYYAISDGGREVALKYLKDNHAIELRGVSHCMNLKSPHLVKIFDVKKNADGEYFIVMEYIGGPSLRDLLIAEPEGIGPQKAAFFLKEIAKGLGYLHERGIVHRDMKPGNIFYDDGYVKIGDYGLSKFIAVSRHSAQTASVGTVHYMAPEIGSGDYQRGIDIYALGVMLYEMLLGRVPYEGSSTGEILMKHLTAQPEVDALPAPFGNVIRRALAKDPKNRYQTVDEMAEEMLGVDAVVQSLSSFEPMSLTAAVYKGAGQPPATPTGSGPPPPPPIARPVSAKGVASGVANAMRDLANVTGDALKAAAAGVPYGTPADGRPLLSPEASSGRVQYAGFWIRLLASLIDVMLVGLVCALLPLPDNATGGILLIYQAILIGTWNGQTIGKRACGIKVISNNGFHPTLGQSFGRSFSKILNVFTLMIGYLMIPFDWQRRGLHDRIAGTLAIHAVH